MTTRRKNSPGRYADTTDKLDTEGALDERRQSRDARRCTGDGTDTKCIAEPTEFVRWVWWCAVHAPVRGRSDCHHCVTSPLHGRLVCQTCFLDMGEL